MTLFFLPTNGKTANGMNCCPIEKISIVLNHHNANYKYQRNIKYIKKSRYKIFCSALTLNITCYKLANQSFHTVFQKQLHYATRKRSRANEELNHCEDPYHRNYKFNIHASVLVK